MENLAYRTPSEYNNHRKSEHNNDVLSLVNEWLAADPCVALPDPAFIRNQSCRQLYEAALRIRLQEREKLLDTMHCIAREGALTEAVCMALMAAYCLPVGC